MSNPRPPSNSTVTRVCRAWIRYPLRLFPEGPCSRVIDRRYTINPLFCRRCAQKFHEDSTVEYWVMPIRKEKRKLFRVRMEMDISVTLPFSLLIQFASTFIVDNFSELRDAYPSSLCGPINRPSSSSLDALLTAVDIQKQCASTSDNSMQNLKREQTDIIDLCSSESGHSDANENHEAIEDDSDEPLEPRRSKRARFNTDRFSPDKEEHRENFLKEKNTKERLDFDKKICDERYDNYCECPPTCFKDCNNNRIQKGVFKETYSNPSSYIPQANGLFAFDDIQKGELICTFPGKYVSMQKVDPEEQCLRPEREHRVVVPGTKDKNISAWLINHSHKPNAKSYTITTYTERGAEIQVAAVFAEKEIKAHDEICLDYHCDLQAGEKPEVCVCIVCQTARRDSSFTEEGLLGHIQRWNPPPSKPINYYKNSLSREYAALVPERCSIERLSFSKEVINNICREMDRLWFSKKFEDLATSLVLKGFDTYDNLLGHHDEDIQRKSTRKVDNEDITRYSKSYPWKNTNLNI